MAKSDSGRGDKVFARKISVGFGDAVKKMIYTELTRALMPGGVELAEVRQSRDEFNLIVEALNQYNVNIDFECGPNADDIEEGMALFAESAKSSCCRVLPYGTSSRRRKQGEDVRDDTDGSARRTPRKKRLGLFAGKNKRPKE